MKLGKSRYYFQIGLLVTVLVFLGALTWPKAEAQTGSSPVKGYAWSDNIGWIHFDWSDVPDDQPVMINSAGELSGFAWSDNIGWISLNRDGAGGTDNPPSDDPGVGDGAIAEVNGNNVVGWARAISAVGRNDGWDGWIRFDHNKANPVTVDGSGRVDGYAWGSDVVGWIDMSPGGGPPEGCEIDGTCPDNPDCDPTIRVCGPGGDNNLSVSCEMPATGSINTPVPFTVVTNPVVDPADYVWEWTNGEGAPVEENAVTVGGVSGDNDIMVTFNQQGTYRGEVTVTSGGETLAVTCSHDAGETIVIGGVENPDLFEVDSSSCLLISRGKCVMVINKDNHPSDYSEGHVKLINRTDGAVELNWSALDVPAELDIEFCRSASGDDCTSGLSEISMSGDVYIRARILDIALDNGDYYIPINASLGGGSPTVHEVTVRYIKSGTGTGSKNSF